MLSFLAKKTTKNYLRGFSTNIISEQVLQRTIQRCSERNIVIPTYDEMFNPQLIPNEIQNDLSNIGLWDINPRNLFRVTWKNEQKEFGGGFGGANYIEIPKELSGVDARIIVLLGKYLPTGSHKVGASFGPIVEKLVRGGFDPTTQKALWPSTGNYCRGGAFNSELLGCQSLAVMPEGMSQERFDWLESIGSEIYRTKSTESNIKEIFTKMHQLEKEMGDSLVVLNQFTEFANPMWHYAVTGRTMEELYNQLATPRSNFKGLFLNQGSGGTLGSSMYLHQKFPNMKTACGEAIQCPTLLENGYGKHRIEGIGDTYVPWILNLKDMDLLVGIDDQDCVDLLRLFNEKPGQEFLLKKGVEKSLVDRLSVFGISSIGNLLGAIKFAKYYEMKKDDFIFTVATDSAALYQSRLKSFNQKLGGYTQENAISHYYGSLMKQNIQYMQELSYYEKKRCHHLKYFTWVEQEGKSVKELDQQWDDDYYWIERMEEYKNLNHLIRSFNQRSKDLKKSYSIPKYSYKENEVAFH
ncbi:cystathionine beta-synthase [Anaeramoeba flamelloides]|uniref:Cystathionine beta-synthase n=1 Tax=Anaeramoeba flamelloides TaxID=1746091 RepID=A0AAV8AFD9_9EUKA|nr:cystathionine beta-synthase [Anaeramoeba flamelloides]